MDGHERRGERGVTLVELVTVLAILAVGLVAAMPAVRGVLATARTHGATASLYGALHLTKSRARATGTTHALVLEPGGRGFRIVEDPAGAARTVVGPLALADGVVATANATIRFSPKGFAVPFGTITVRSEDVVHRIVVNILGRARVAGGAAPA